MYLDQLSRPFAKAWAANANTSSFASKIPTITEPTNDGVVNLTAGYSAGGITPITMMVLPYGLGADEDAFDMRIIGWRHIGPAAPAIPLWVPTILGQFSCTLGTAAGVAGAPVLNTELFADTITVGSEPTITADVTRFGTVRVYSPTANLVAYLIIQVYGCEKVEFSFDQTTNTPTMNCLIALL